jgi:anti-sigma regulatory factor (Ser/Thr protein kinase)
MINPADQPCAIFTKFIRIPSERSNIHMTEAFLEEIQKFIDINEDILDKIMISITEGVNNGIIHGNASNPAKTVLLTCNCYVDYLEFIIQDEGPGFDPEELPDPFHEDNILNEGGRGVLIINTMMDEVEYKRTKNGMNITMRIAR